MSEEASYDLLNYLCISFPTLQISRVNHILQLKDGTLLSCSGHPTIMRWTGCGKLLGTYLGHLKYVFCLMEVDDNTFLSCSDDNTMKLWNKTTRKCQQTLHSGAVVFSLLKLRNNSSFLCGMHDGSMQEREMVENYEVLHELQEHESIIGCMCELSSNGWVVSGSYDKTLIVWDMNTRTVVHRLVEHKQPVWRVTELKRGDKLTIIASGSDDTICIWDVTTGVCLQVLNVCTDAEGAFVGMSDGCLLSGCYDATIQVWRVRGSNGEYHTSSKSDIKCHISCTTELRDGSLAIGSQRGHIQVRKTWLSKQPSLVELCCQLVANHYTEFDMTALQQCLPTDLNEHIKQLSPYESSIDHYYLSQLWIE
eukprot:TRINITY_DN5276_c0_g2_i1.p1 TRINITY_DN5276_c0_g2~~TRINITY_DN5276_c0_g2_i1.p1  ORF type:complete len:365 (+),score=33.35 TRINITY_DN5276_c0_g2_i1:56-1150(+)